MTNISFAESVLPFLKDKNVEIYTGSSEKERHYSDYDSVQKEVIRGTLKDAKGDMLIVEVTINHKTNLIFVNCWMVVAIIEPKNGISMDDSYCDAHAKQVK